MPLTDNTPILIGVGVASQRCEDPLAAAEPITLMRQAAQRAGADAGNAAWLSQVDSIGVPQGLWAYSNPAKLVAETIGAARSRTTLAQLGVLQHTLIHQAMRDIDSGASQLALVIGAEAKYRSLRAAITGVPSADTPQHDSEPDQTLRPERELVHPSEQACGLQAAAHYYAIMENALRCAQGQSVAEHRDDIARMWSAFSHLAQHNPDAWQREPAPPEAIRDAQGKNAMIAFPYTKMHNSQWNVDQGAALLLASARWAREHGVDPRVAVWPLSATEANHMTALSERAALHRCAGAALAGGQALALAGLDAASELDHIDLYSCFPVAVRMQALELGMDPNAPPMPLSVTGGMRFAGGPLNNYVLQATACMAQRLRRQGGRGMVSGISGLMTKQGFGVWGAARPEEGFQFADLSAQTARETALREVAPDADGPARIAGCTVVHDNGAPSAAVAICDLADGRRAVAANDDPALMARAMESECIGWPVTIRQHRFTLDPAAG